MLSHCVLFLYCTVYRAPMSNHRVAAYQGPTSLVPRPLSFFCVGVGKERVWWISVCGFV